MFTLKVQNNPKYLRDCWNPSIFGVPEIFQRLEGDFRECAKMFRNLHKLCELSRIIREIFHNFSQKFIKITTTCNAANNRRRMLIPPNWVITLLNNSLAVGNARHMWQLSQLISQVDGINFIQVCPEDERKKLYKNLCNFFHCQTSLNQNKIWKILLKRHSEKWVYQSVIHHVFKEIDIFDVSNYERKRVLTLDIFMHRQKAQWIADVVD